MMWKCSNCGESFQQPNMLTYDENLDGENGWMRWKISICPICGSEDIEEKKENDYAEM